MTRVSMADIHRQFSDDIRALNPELFGPLSIDAHKQLEEGLKTEPQNRRGNKYGARKTTVGDLAFDSQKEANRYLVLKAQEEAGEISSLILQCEIQLLEGFTYQGEKVRPIRYTADFVYTREGKTYVEDVKSAATAKTEAFRLRWRLLQWYYRDVPDVVLLLTGD